MTDEITFNDDPDVPSVILNKPGVDPRLEIGDIVWIDKNAIPPISEQFFEVEVRDENLFQELVAHIRVIHDEDVSPRFDSRNLPLGALRRDLRFPVRASELRDRKCHRLELVVSGRFFDNETDPEFFDKVRPDEDNTGETESDPGLAYASWWILEGDKVMDTMDMTASAAQILASCNTIESMLAAQGLEAQEPDEEP